MPFGMEQAFAVAVSAAAVVLGVVFASLWAGTNDPDAPRVAGMATPAAFDEPPFCKHLVVQGKGAHQFIVRVNSLPENPPPPVEGVNVTIGNGTKSFSSGLTDLSGCASLPVPRRGSYVFEASVEQTDDEATHRWWSNAMTRNYSGESPGFVEIRLSNYARYA